MEPAVNETLVYVISLARDLRNGDVPAAVLALLIELGLQSSSDGFTYLRQAICIRWENPNMKLPDIYERIVSSADPGTTVRQVEQAMLSAIGHAWKHRNVAKWDYFFREEGTGKRKKPGNKDFIFHLACVMELWVSHCQGVSCGKK